ncbi:MAG: hypothetical protein M3Y08_04350 [Fibrobacterota bacterium]|nr:hypothetical protein [Fibrobacterota bacterium]
MLKKQSSLRNFKGGSWDLRKLDRRKELHEIGFPDRRANQRRFYEKADHRFSMESLQWVNKSALDE